MMTFLSKRSTFLGLLFLADAFLIVLSAFAWLVITLPRLPDNPQTLLAQSGINIYAQSGELLYTFNQRVDQIQIEDVNPYFVKAVLATEDLDFYHHHGYSLKGIAGAVIDNLRSGKKTRGGSTLTQQIIKNIFLTRDKQYTRKLKEVFLAAQLETMFERHYGPTYKGRLLELYINGSFYGTHAYGISDAAQTYFGKHPSKLTLLESALLAGLPNAPSALNPYRQDLDRIKTRISHVLKRMETAGFITQLEREQALADSLRLNPNRTPQNRTPYFVETIKSEIIDLWGSSALNFGGLNIYTTLDLAYQQAAEQAISEGLSNLDTRLGFSPYEGAPPKNRDDYVQGALLCLDPRTGHIKAMVGGRDIFVSYYNRATQAKRQPGSGFKPIVYLAAFETGTLTPLSLFIDEPRTYRVNNENWTPKNFKDSYLGLTTAAQALVKSANATSVQIAFQIGPEKIVSLAKRLGIQSPLKPYPSIALGAQEITLLDLVTAYGTIARYGFRVTPTFIRKITNSEDRTIYTHQPNPIPVINAEHAYTINKLMQHVVNHGTGRRVRALGFTAPTAGKTGTTNDNTDAWFTGFTPNLVTSVWVGFDNRQDRRQLIDKRTKAQITGGNGAAPIWTNFMKSVNPKTGTFITPDGITEHPIDLRTGIADTTSNAILIALPNGILPNTPADTLAFYRAQMDSTH
ncbi:MAG: penicillin-binding protein 1A [Candidatus Latescibacterota bacterium]|jgi:penicillin-binding protein 1A